MPIPPLGEVPLKETAATAFEMLNRLNDDPLNGRIENLDLTDCSDLDLWRFNRKLKSWDYLYDRLKLSELKGNRYKGKRNPFNSFTKQHRPRYLPFSTKDLTRCLELYDQWMEKKKRNLTHEEDDYEACLLEDSRKAHQRMMNEFEMLGLIGRVVWIESEIRGYIFGAELNASTLIVIAEVTELSVKGLAQYIFRTFCEEMDRYHWINVMDDSGLDSLRKVKESYFPDFLAPAYILDQRRIE